MAVSWFDGAIDNPSPASDVKVQKAERELGVRLREDFLAIAKTHQGAMPEPECFDLPKGGRGSIKYLLHFEEEPFYSNIVARVSRSATFCTGRSFPLPKTAGCCSIPTHVKKY